MTLTTRTDFSSHIFHSMPVERNSRFNTYVATCTYQPYMYIIQVISHCIISFYTRVCFTPTLTSTQVTRRSRHTTIKNAEFAFQDILRPCHILSCAYLVYKGPGQAKRGRFGMVGHVQLLWDATKAYGCQPVQTPGHKFLVQRTFCALKFFPLLMRVILNVRRSGDRYSGHSVMESKYNNTDCMCNCNYYSFKHIMQLCIFLWSAYAKYTITSC